MSEPALTREAWHRLTLSATGLTALAFTVDDMIGLAPMDRKERERLHGLSAALLSLTRSVEEAIIAMDDAHIWEAPMFVREEQAPAA